MSALYISVIHMSVIYMSGIHMSVINISIIHIECYIHIIKSHSCIFRLIHSPKLENVELEIFIICCKS